MRRCADTISLHTRVHRRVTVVTSFNQRIGACAHTRGAGGRGLRHHGRQAYTAARCGSALDGARPCMDQRTELDEESDRELVP